jgi:hypothetical protein
MTTMPGGQQATQYACSQEWSAIHGGSQAASLSSEPATFNTSANARQASVTVKVPTCFLPFTTIADPMRLSAMFA